MAGDKQAIARMEAILEDHDTRVSAQSIMAEADRQGFETQGIAKGNLVSFVGCVVEKLFQQPLPKAIAECGEKYLKAGD